MGRIEYKYLVANSQLDDLRKSILPYLELDIYSKIMPDNRYIVRSIYLDTPQLSYYHDKLAGLKKRFKVRVRGYNTVEDNAPVFLEIKRKNEATIHKSRFKTDMQQVAAIFNGRGSLTKSNPVDDAAFSSFYYQFYSSHLRPVINIIYDREAYFYRFNHGLRITFDMNIRSMLAPALNRLYVDGRVVPTLRGYFILEVKTAQELPSWLRQILSYFHLQNQALSKYTMSLDQQRPRTQWLEKSIVSQQTYFPGFFQN